MPHTVSHVRPDPQLCAQHFGNLIRSARFLRGRPLEEVAPLAALTVEEWLAIEDGDVSYVWEQMLLIGNVLHCGPIWMGYLLEFYKGATQQ